MTPAPESVRAQLAAAADALEQIYLQRGVDSPYMALASRIDAVVRELDALPDVYTARGIYARQTHPSGSYSHTQ